MDKQEQSTFVRSRGMLIPNSTIIEKNNCTSLNWDEYPCIIKPIKSICGGGKDDIKIAKTHDDLVDKIKNDLSEIVQVQKYIEKEMEYQLIGCSLNSGEDVIIPGYTRILRQQKNTNTGYLEYSPISNIQIDIDQVKKLLRILAIMVCLVWNSFEILMVMIIILRQISETMGMRIVLSWRELIFLLYGAITASLVNCRVKLAKLHIKL